MIVLTTVKTNLAIINFDGSSTMRAAIENIFKFSPTKNNLSISGVDYNINIQSSGTTTGIIKALNKSSDFVLASQNTDKWSKDVTFRKRWTENQLKTLTIAQDAIVLLYKPPKGCQADLVVDKNTIKTIYSLFTGHKYPGTVNEFSSLISSASEHKSKEECKALINSYAKVGGENKSGTSYAFLHYNPLFQSLRKDIEALGPTKEHDAPRQWLKNVLSSKTASDFKDDNENNEPLHFTQENSILSYERFLFDLSDQASMIYLPSSFVFSNIDSVEKHGLKIAKFKKDDSMSSDLTINNFQDEITSGKYPWVRNLNIIYSVKDITIQNRDIVNYIVNNAKNLSSLYFLPIKFIEKETSSSTGQIPAPTTSHVNDKVKSYEKAKLFLFDKDDCNADGWTQNTCSKD